MNENLIKTKDLNQAAYLIAKGQKLVDSQPDNDNRFWFMFVENSEIETYTKEYYMNDGAVKVQDFINAQKTLKNLIRNYKTRT